MLHTYPIPLVEIDSRKMGSRLQRGEFSQKLFNDVVSWKTRNGIESSEESEYRYLLRDLGVVSARSIDSEVDGGLPLGGDGPVISSIVSNRTARMFYLTTLGERLLELYRIDRALYENYLFWLIIRNKLYLPLLQQIICNPQSYFTEHIEELIRSSDKISVNSALAWGKYLGIVTRGQGGYYLVPQNLATKVLSASLLEVNASCMGKDTWYVADMIRLLGENLSLSTSAVDFIAVLDLIFKHTSREVVLGYGSSREDLSLRRHPKIQLLQFPKEVPLSIVSEMDSAEILKVLSFLDRRPNEHE
jgi:hypothetical protein